MSQFVLLPSRVQIQIQNAQTQVQRTVTIPAVVRFTVMLSGIRRLMPLCPFYKVIGKLTGKLARYLAYFY